MPCRFLLSGRRTTSAYWMTKEIHIMEANAYPASYYLAFLISLSDINLNTKSITAYGMNQHNALRAKITK